jgi:hypothetical protein
MYLSGGADLPLAFWWLDDHGRPARIEIGRHRDGRIVVH